NFNNEIGISLANVEKSINHHMAKQSRQNWLFPMILSLIVLLAGMALGRYLTLEYEINPFQPCHQIVRSQDNPTQLYCQLTKPLKRRIKTQ
ncbi:hypothetical protein DX884_22645, partial [Vibrio fluvialis]|nr:hypothetical protein [Vibrio fluvialis]